MGVGQWTVGIVHQQWAGSKQWAVDRGQWAPTEWQPSGIESVRYWNFILPNLTLFTKPEFLEISV